MTTTLRAAAITLPTLIAFAATACTPNSQPGADAQRSQAAAEAPAAASAPAQAPALDDADIAAIVVAANTIDIQYGEIARERATNQQVKQFAETMIKDHTAVNQSATELVTRLGVTPTPNDVSRSLESQAAEMREVLRSKSGAEFDRAYIDNEVAYHRAVLQAIDEVLIPNASNAELKQTLVNVRPAVEAHLRHAEEIQRTLSRGA
jgi:putative membrane protein